MGEVTNWTVLIGDSYNLPQNLYSVHLHYQNVNLNLI